ncbi:MAG: hypothetical protein NC299_15460 [Lachnospiraceae bacterium]|nr:hypothetical protein [Ruminococcus sp.]MCM1276731.1 hypothetical protein [Lachnospiraceae bacterium]
MNNITAEQREKMYFRRYLIKDKLRGIERLITGRSESFLPFITDENGKTDKDKLDKFISGMLEALKHDAAFDKTRSLSEDDLKMYESFLYCAVMSLVLRRSIRNSDVIMWSLPKTFDDIARRAASAYTNRFADFNEYLIDCYRRYREGRDSSLGKKIGYVGDTDLVYDPDFFREMKFSLYQINYYTFINHLPERTLELLRDNYENGTEITEPLEAPIAPPPREDPQPVFNGDEEDEPEYNEPEYDEDGAYEDFWFDYYDYDADALAEEHEREQTAEFIEEGLSELSEDETYSDNRILKNIPTHEIVNHLNEKFNIEELPYIKSTWEYNILADKQALCAHFYRFMKLFLDSPNRGLFVSDVENMVDTFLYERGISPFSFGDDYAVLSYYVKQTQKRVARDVERRRGK